MTEATQGQAPKLPNSLDLIKALGIIAMVSGLLVVLAFQITMPLIKRNQREALEKAVFTVLPEATTRVNYLLDENGLVELPDEAFEKANVFAGYDPDGKLVGLAMEASARGYQDVVKILYGYNPDSQCVVGITVLESRETPGLGDKVNSDADFLSNFNCLDASLSPVGSVVANPIQTVKHGKKTESWQIDAISGATITSTAVGNALRDSTTEMLPLFVAGKSSLKVNLETASQSQ